MKNQTKNWKIGQKIENWTKIEKLDKNWKMNKNWKIGQKLKYLTKIEKLDEKSELPIGCSDLILSTNSSKLSDLYGALPNRHSYKMTPTDLKKIF